MLLGAGLGSACGGAMKVGIPKEIVAGERRVAVIPETVKRLAGMKVEAAVEAGAGEGAFIPDSEYEAAGAAVVQDAAEVFGAELVIKVNAPTTDGSAGRCELDLLKEGSALVALLYPRTNADLVRKLARAGVTSLSLDLMPRITRAQSMDVLSSMSTVSGYRAVLVAAEALPELMPMLMTAAGTIRPSKALIIGAGVAGLQAIATARRLGAVVKAVDVRPAVQEQIESLGARFVSMEVQVEKAETAGGYAADLGEEVYRRQREILAPHVAESDIVITTALVPGREAPRLISEEMVESMKPGSVIVDLAAPAGGNCALTKPGERTVQHGVTIFGPLNLPSEMAVDASRMFSRNIGTYLGELIKDGQLALDMENEVVRETLVTRDGEIVNESVKKAIGEGGKEGGT
jgi:NAD(P) transhydrogenase subunit alpha